MNVSVHSPTRVDLAGGTLDLWPLHSFTGGAVTVNIAIDVKTHASLEDTAGSIVIESDDLRQRREYPTLSALLAEIDPQFHYYRVILRELNPAKGFHLRTRSECPVGAGLGGSSSLTISILKAFEKWSGAKPEGVDRMVYRAHNLEAEILNTPTGTQDYYPAACGGINVIRYSATGIAHEVLPLAGTPFAERALLVYTGRTHHSGLNNFEVMKSAVGRDSTVMKALFNLRDVSEEMEEAVRTGKWNGLAPLFQREYDARILLTKAFTCPEIEQLAAISKKAGADAIKICGAGGGGCVMVWCPDGARETIAEACRKAGFQIMNARPVAPLSPS